MTEKKKLRAVSYNRVSPTKEINTPEGLAKSLENQISQNTKAIENDGCLLVGIYKDQYISGSDADALPDFQRLKADALEGKFDIVYCLRDDRLGRSQRDAIEIIDDFSTKQQVHIHEEVVTKRGKSAIAKVKYKIPHKIHFKFVEEHLETSTADGQMMAGLLSTIAERQRKRIIENTTRGRYDLMTRMRLWKEGKGERPKKLLGRKAKPISDNYIIMLKDVQKLSYNAIAKKLMEENPEIGNLSAPLICIRYKNAKKFNTLKNIGENKKAET